MDPLERADAALARARARGAFVVTPESAVSPMDAANTLQIPRIVVAANDQQRKDDPDATLVVPFVDVTGEPGTPPVLVVDGDGVIAVPCSSRVIATLGVADLIVVDTADAVLVCHRDRAQDIKKLTELLRERGHAAHV